MGFCGGVERNHQNLFGRISERALTQSPNAMFYLARAHGGPAALAVPKKACGRLAAESNAGHAQFHSTGKVTSAIEPETDAAVDFSRPSNASKRAALFAEITSKAPHAGRNDFPARMPAPSCCLLVVGQWLWATAEENCTRNAMGCFGDSSQSRASLEAHFGNILRRQTTSPRSQRGPLGLTCSTRMQSGVFGLETPSIYSPQIVLERPILGLAHCHLTWSMESRRKPSTQRGSQFSSPARANVVYQCSPYLAPTAVNRTNWGYGLQGLQLHTFTEAPRRALRSGLTSQSRKLRASQEKSVSTTPRTTSPEGKSKAWGIRYRSFSRNDRCFPSVLAAALFFFRRPTPLQSVYFSVRTSVPRDSSTRWRCSDGAGCREFPLH